MTHLLKSKTKRKNVIIFTSLTFVIPDMNKLSDRRRGKLKVKIVSSMNKPNEGKETDAHASKCIHKYLPVCQNTPCISASQYITYSAAG
jgi:hypothetical protein